MPLRLVLRRFGLLCVLPCALLCLLLLTGCGGGKISRSNYEKVRTGMTEEDVEAVLGPGKDVTVAPPKDPKAPKPPAVPGMPANAKIKVWQDGDRSITVVFGNGKVDRKSSKGL